MIYPVSQSSPPPQESSTSLWKSRHVQRFAASLAIGASLALILSGAGIGLLGIAAVGLSSSIGIPLTAIHTVSILSGSSLIAKKASTIGQNFLKSRKTPEYLLKKLPKTPRSKKRQRTEPANRLFDKIMVKEAIDPRQKQKKSCRFNDNQTDEVTLQFGYYESSSLNTKIETNKEAVVIKKPPERTGRHKKPDILPLQNRFQNRVFDLSILMQEQKLKEPATFNKLSDPAKTATVRDLINISQVINRLTKS